jgi:polyisoprenoid-binding protein YceI
MKPLLPALLAAAVALAAPLAVRAQTPIEERPAPAGSYELDPAHTRVIFRVSHLGFSMYTGFFKDVSGSLDFAPEAPETMSVSARIGVASVETHYPDPAVDFNAIIAGPEFLNATPEAPDITFASTAVKQTGERTADVTGDLTLNGVTQPVTLAVTFNGGYAGHPLDAGARIGFSATGAINRSDFGIAFGIPAPGTTLGVGDRVEIVIEAEFIDPEAPKE